MVLQRMKSLSANEEHPDRDVYTRFIHGGDRTRAHFTFGPNNVYDFQLIQGLVYIPIEEVFNQLPNPNEE